ncbi:hypothetical protein ACS0TY_009386 [Phlomoides rotata]
MEVVGQEVVAVAAAGMGAGSSSAAARSPTLAPGFRFHPTDEELVWYYLRRKVCGKPFRFEAVTEIDVYKSEPWQLAEYSALKTRDQEWYFFSAVDKKYGNGSRLNRATGKGYWKATGKDRSVFHNTKTVGMKKTLVFHSGRAPDGKRTNWVMHEYRLCDSDLETAAIIQDAFVLCRIFLKNGMGPPNGNRYAPFLEEEWDDQTVIVIPGGDVEDDVANGDEARGGFAYFDEDTPSLSIAPPENPMYSSIIIPYKRSPDVDTELDLNQNKRSRHDDPYSSHAHGSEDSTTTSQAPSMMMTKIESPPLLEFSLLEPLGSKENPPTSATTFDSSTLEKSVPPGYLKFISNLENEILNTSMEKETLKIEVMRAQAMINILQSQIETLGKENKELRRRG